MKPSTSISRSLRFGRSLIRKVKNCFTGYKPTESASGSKERSCNLSETIRCGDGGYSEMIQNAIIYCKDSLIKEELNDGSKEVFADENDEAGKSRQIHYADAAIDRLLNRDQLGDEDATMDDEEDDGFLKAFKVKPQMRSQMGYPLQLLVVEQIISLHATLVVFDRHHHKYREYYAEKIPYSMVMMNEEGEVDMIRGRSHVENLENISEESLISSAPTTKLIIAEHLRKIFLTKCSRKSCLKIRSTRSA